MKRLTANWPALPSASSAGGEALQLQWADYLEERGEGEWAELIRLQLALNRLGAMAASVRPEWLEREAELRALLAQRWQAELGELLVGPLQFRGGIPDTVAVAAPVFIDRAAELFARLPLRRVRLLDVAGCWNKLWQCPWLARLQELDLCATDLAQLDLTPLWRSPHLRALRGLDLSFNQLTNDLLRPLQRHCPFPQLRRLALNDNRLTGQVFELLGSSACVSTLEEVDLSHNEITAEGLAEVAVHPWPRLHLLRLSGNPLGDAGVALLATSPLLAQMVGQHGRLELRGHAQVRISAAGAT
ncbi:MAG: hypothetical protein NZ703_13065, partial [Gemmataceae bacterium]|nr:hypothetical protein [Gemmataceae bacterium]